MKRSRSQALRDPAWLGLASEGFAFAAAVFFVCCFCICFIAGRWSAGFAGSDRRGDEGRGLGLFGRGGRQVQGGGGEIAAVYVGCAVDRIDSCKSEAWIFAHSGSGRLMGTAAGPGRPPRLRGERSDKVRGCWSPSGAWCRLRLPIVVDRNQHLALFTATIEWPF